MPNEPMTDERLALLHKQFDPAYPMHAHLYVVDTTKELLAEVERLHADRKTQDRVLARLNEQVPALVAEIERLQKALQTIADYERPRQATSAWPVITTLQNTARQALGDTDG